MIKTKYPLKLGVINYDKIWGSESWVLTVRDNAISEITNGVYKNMLLSEYLGSMDFPLLVKFINAVEKLSIQVHPDKTELWYIVSAKPDAQIVYGFNGSYNKSQINTALENGTIESLLKFVNVKAGESYYIPAGLIHAIGGGILIAEIQQNSDTTYRFYDYNRPRPLHVDLAMETIRNFDTITPSDRYFKVTEHTVDGKAYFNADNSSFHHILCLDGEGILNGTPIEKYDSFLIPAFSGTYEFSEYSHLRFLRSMVLT